MKKSGAAIVIESLCRNKVRTVFGYPGGAVLPIYDELYKNSRRLNHVLCAHEQNAAHAADGFARVTGRPGVVISTSGPGATNLVTGIANAYLDSVPLVAEGAGAIGVAAVLAKKLELSGKKVCAVVSGGNIDVNILSRVINRGLLSSGRVAELKIAMLDKPGQLQEVSAIIAGCGANVIQVRHDPGGEHADIIDFARFNAVYAKYFAGKPARSCVAAAALPGGALVEVEVTALV